MGAPKLTNAEFTSLNAPLVYERDTPICRRCGHVTYPSAWCECDPRSQIEACLIAEAEEHGVLLRPHNDDELLELSP